MPASPELLSPEERAAATARAADIDFDALEAAADVVAPAPRTHPQREKRVDSAVEIANLKKQLEQKFMKADASLLRELTDAMVQAEGFEKTIVYLKGIAIHTEDKGKKESISQEIVRVEQQKALNEQKTTSAKERKAAAEKRAMDNLGDAFSTITESVVKTKEEKDAKKLFAEIEAQAEQEGSHVYADRASEIKNARLRLKALQAALEGGFMRLDVLHELVELMVKQDGREKTQAYLHELRTNLGAGTHDAINNEIAGLERAGQEQERKKTEQKEMENLGQAFEKIGKTWESGEVERKMQELRDRYVRAQENMRKFQGILGAVGGLFKQGEKYNVQEELHQAKDAYETFYGNYVAEQVTRLIGERGALADRLADSYATRENSWAREFYNGYKKLGEWNLEKVFEPKSKTGKFIARIASVRTLISGGLLGIGVWAGAGVAVGAAAVGLRRIMAGVGTAGFSYDLMDNYARVRERTKGKLREVTEQDRIRGFTDTDLIDRIAALETDAKLRGKKVSETETYKTLLEIWAERIKYKHIWDKEIIAPEAVTHQEKEERARAIAQALEIGSRTIDQNFDSVLKNRRRADNWRKTGALTLGVFVGSGMLYKSISHIKDALLGSPTADTAASSAGAVDSPTDAEPHSEDGPIPLPADAEAHTDGTIEIPTDSHENFLQDHSLLRDQGFDLDTDAEGITRVTAEIGRGKTFDHLQQALRRLIVDAMDPEKLHGNAAFDHIDAGRAENVVANLSNILEQDKTSLGHSVEELKQLGISFNGKQLAIDDYSKFKALFDATNSSEGLFAHAESIIVNQSDALAYTDNTGRRIWQEMWDQKMKAPSLVRVENFAANEYVTAAEHRVFTAHANDLGLGDEVRVFPIDEDTGTIRTLTGVSIEIDHDVVQSVTGPDGNAITLPEEALNIRDAAGQERLRDLFREWINPYDGDDQAFTQQRTGVLYDTTAGFSSEPPEPATFKEMLPQLVKSDGYVHFGDVKFDEGWITEIADTSTRKFVNNPTSEWTELFNPRKARALGALADAVKSNPDPNAQKIGAYIFAHYDDTLKRVRVRLPSIATGMG